MSAVVLMASPRRGGRCERWARETAHELQDADGMPAPVIRVADLCIAGCRACDACRTAPDYACIIRDDMDSVNDALSQANVLVLVTPVYFAGPPAQLKALLDRLQPHFWRGTRKLPKRRALLYVVGDGGDPHGYEPLVTIVRSALAVAGFELEATQARIGAPAAEEGN